MPDSAGLLTPEDHGLIKAWFARTWKQPVVCQVCGHSEWTYGPHLVQTQRYGFDSGAPNTITYPYVVVSCSHCAHTMFFGAVTMGVQPPAPPNLANLSGFANAFARTAGLGQPNALSKFLTPPTPPIDPKGRR
jgi:hypothetical protein